MPSLTHTAKIPIRSRNLTCVALSHTGSKAWVGDENGKVYIIEIATRKITSFSSAQGGLPNSAILSITCDITGQYTATGHADGSIRLWNAETTKFVQRLPAPGKPRGHTKAVSALGFVRDKKGAAVLISGSFDRVVNVWNLSELPLCNPVELQGSTGAVLSVDACSKDKVLAGGSDSQALVFLVPKDKAMQFSPLASDIESIAFLGDQFFACCTAGDGGIQVFQMGQTTPLLTESCAHGRYTEPAADNEDVPLSGPNWVTSLCALPGSGCFISGGAEGVLKLWKFEKCAARLREARTKASANASRMLEQSDGEKEESEHDEEDDSDNETGNRGGKKRRGRAAGRAKKRAKLEETTNDPQNTLLPLGSCHIGGWVNGLRCTADHKTVVAVSGRHHRLGSWCPSDPHAKNTLHIISVALESKN